MHESEQSPLENQSIQQPFKNIQLSALSGIKSALLFIRKIEHSGSATTHSNLYFAVIYSAIHICCLTHEEKLSYLRDKHSMITEEYSPLQ